MGSGQLSSAVSSWGVTSFRIVNAAVLSEQTALTRVPLSALLTPCSKARSIT